MFAKNTALLSSIVLFGISFCAPICAQDVPPATQEQNVSENNTLTPAEVKDETKITREQFEQHLAEMKKLNSPRLKSRGITERDFDVIAL